MKHIRAGISIGDINGIGIEIILKTFKDNRITDFFTPIIFGSKKLFSIHQQQLGIKESNLHITNSIKNIKKNKINLINCWKENIEVDFGQGSILSGEYARNMSSPTLCPFLNIIGKTTSAVVPG